MLKSNTLLICYESININYLYLYLGSINWFNLLSSNNDIDDNRYCLVVMLSVNKYVS